MSKALKKRFAIAGIALLHLAATGFFSFWTLGFILRRHHYGLSSSEAQQEAIVRTVSQIFEFPLKPLFHLILGAITNSYTPLIWLLNSMLWAFFLYAIAALALRKKESRSG